MTGSISSIGDVRNKKVLDAWWQALFQTIVEGAQRINERWVIGVAQVFFQNVMHKAQFKLSAVSVKPSVRRTTLGDSIMVFHDMTQVMQVRPGDLDSQAHIEVGNIGQGPCPPLFEVRLSDNRLSSVTIDSQHCLNDLHAMMGLWHQQRRTASGSELFYGIYGVVSALLQDGFALTKPLPLVGADQSLYWFDLVQHQRQLTFVIHLDNLQDARQRLDAKFLALEDAHARPAEES